MSDHDFLAELRQQLLDAAPHTPPPRHRGRTAALAGVAVLVVVALAFLVVLRGPDRAAADVVITVEGSDFVVRLTDLETSPGRIEAAAEQEGLDLRVVEVPVGPSNVGRFVGSTADRQADFRPINPRNSTFTGFRISRDWPGSLRLEIGRPARAGERWAAAGDALAPGEALACEPLLGLTVDQARARLADSDLDVRWFMLPAPGEVTDLGPYGDWKVVEVDALSPDSVSVMATDGGTWPFLTPRPTFPSDC